MVNPLGNLEPLSLHTHTQCAFASGNNRYILVSFAFTVMSLLATAQAQSPEVSFELEVLPVLTQAGCNSGACHGAAAGRGNFFLSLWGSNPSADFQQIVIEHQSRRINFESPTDSILIAKPTGRIAHEGSELFEPQSPQAQLLERWISQGAQRGAPANITSLSIESLPIKSSANDSRANKSPANTHSVFHLRTFVSLQNGTRIDVTDRTKWESDPNGAITLTPALNPEANQQTTPNQPTTPDQLIRVELNQPGRHTLVARFGPAFQAISLVAPYPANTNTRTNPSSPQASAGTSAATSVDSSNKKSPSNPIDRWIQRGLDQANLTPANTIDDLSWLRRVYLDLTGKLPSAADIARFEQIPPERRIESTLDQLFASQDFNNYWAYQLARWLPLRPLPNDRESTLAYEEYLKNILEHRRSWRAMAEELIISTGPSNAVGAVNFARLTGDPRTHAEAISRFFMGARLQCANCHNHPLDRWTQDDYHGLAAILAGIDRGPKVKHTPSVRVTNLRTKDTAIPRIPGQQFLPPHSDEQSVKNNLQSLSDWLLGVPVKSQSTPSSNTNPSPFARAITNRLWASMFGRGLVDPIDDIRDTNPPSHPQLLDELCTLFIQADYQPEPILRMIASSQAYRRESYRQSNQSTVDPSFYAVRIDKSLPPEVLFDAIRDTLLTSTADTSNQNQSERAISWLDPTTPSESLDILGRCKRNAPCDTTSQTMGLAQQLHWINGPVVNQPLSSPNTFFRQAILRGDSNSSILAQAYLRVLCRHISEKETDLWLTDIPIAPEDRILWFEDWVWSLLSSSEFLQN